METFTQPKIIGYRQLDEAEADMMNAIKAKGVEIGTLIEVMQTIPNIDQRWVSIGKTNLQQGIMALVRAVAQPTSF